MNSRNKRSPCVTESMHHPFEVVPKELLSVLHRSSYSWKFVCFLLRQLGMDFTALKGFLGGAK